VLAVDLSTEPGEGDRDGGEGVPCGSELREAVCLFVSGDVSVARDPVNGHRGVVFLEGGD
jgi:hypothetical protein